MKASLFSGITVIPQAAWLSYNPATDLLEGNPNENSDAGQFQITVSANNKFSIGKNHAIDQSVIHLNVLLNQPPTSSADVLAFSVVAEENFIINLDSMIMDPEGFPWFAI